MNVAYDEGLVITKEQLRIDVDGTRKNIEAAYADAFALSLSIAYPTPESTTALLQVAHREAYALSMAAAVPTKETIVDLIKRAYMEMLSLSSRLPTLEEKATTAEKPKES